MFQINEDTFFQKHAVFQYQEDKFFQAAEMGQIDNDFLGVQGDEDRVCFRKICVQSDTADLGVFADLPFLPGHFTLVPALVFEFIGEMKIDLIVRVQSFPALHPGGDGYAHSVPTEILDDILERLVVCVPGTQKRQNRGFNRQSLFVSGVMSGHCL